VPVVIRTKRDYADAAGDGTSRDVDRVATVLWRSTGRTVLTDPIWSERCSPSTLIGAEAFSRAADFAR